MSDDKDKFKEKLQEIIRCGRNTHNHIENLEIIEILQDMNPDTDEIGRVVDTLENNGIAVRRYTNILDEMILYDEKEIDVEKIDLLLPEGVSMDDSQMEYVVKAGNASQIPRDEEIKLAKKIELNDKAAKTRLEEAYRWLVVSIAKEYSESCVPFDELIDAGRQGLCDAVNDYDYRNGYSFLIYAEWRTRQNIMRNVMERARNLIKIDHVFFKLYMGLGRRPTLYEVSEEMMMSVKEVECLLGLLHDLKSADKLIPEYGRYAGYADGEFNITILSSKTENLKLLLAEDSFAFTELEQEFFRQYLELGYKWGTDSPKEFCEKFNVTSDQFIKLRIKVYHVNRRYWKNKSRRRRSYRLKRYLEE